MTIATIRTGMEISQMTGNRMTASTASGQQSTSKTHQSKKPNKSFMRRDYSSGEMVSGARPNRQRFQAESNSS